MSNKQSTGRPPKFKSVEELQKKIDDYFNKIDIKNELVIPPQRLKPYTITGLAMALDTSRETLCNYEKKDEFFDAIRKGKQRVEEYAEEHLYHGPASGPTFILKNLGWKDERQSEISTGNLSSYESIVQRLASKDESTRSSE